MEHQDIFPYISDEDDENYAEELQLKQTLEDYISDDDNYAEKLQLQQTLEDYISDDDNYAEELQLQQTLEDSLIITSNSHSQNDPSSSSSGQWAVFNPEQNMFMTKGESSSSIIICEICTEPKKTEEMFKIQTCYHSFCSECVMKQVATKIQDKISPVSCPGFNCKGVLELESCGSLLPKELFDKWDKLLCESLFVPFPKLYCPFKDCSAMLLDENEGVEDIRESECPFCHRMFCASCHVPWHPGIGCEEYQKLNVDERGSEDLLVRELANQKQWRRCPKCKFYVEKNEGCLHITCRCRFEFCYACGEQWSSTHGGCQTN